MLLRLIICANCSRQLRAIVMTMHSNGVLYRRIDKL